MGGARGTRFSTVSVMARAALAWERLWPALWPAAAVAGLFLAAALSDVLLLLPGWLHLLVLLAFAAALAAALGHGRRGWRAIDNTQVRHRLERDNALSHRPLTALGDRLAGGAEDPAARALWRAHPSDARGALAASRVRGRPPSPPADGPSRQLVPGRHRPSSDGAAPPFDRARRACRLVLVVDDAIELELLEQVRGLGGAACRGSAAA